MREKPVFLSFLTEQAQTVICITLYGTHVIRQLRQLDDESV
ncbi:hypothetical protein [Calothrix sp. UHCC 0171]|nr:hypothetical protein [Calothrix sp. UHCC 0171]MEA5573965.1 hypothetical protein [Calothrix sp. UHCC 0171]